MKQGIKRIRVTKQERMTIVSLYSAGAGSAYEIAKAVGRPTSTVYAVLRKAGLHEVKSRNPKEPAPIKLPEPTLVEAGTITMIRGPRRSLWQRIKDFFA